MRIPSRSAGAVRNGQRTVHGVACRFVCLIFLWCAAGYCLAADSASAASDVLDASKYRARCLMCHSATPPEGVAQRIMSGLTPKKDSQSTADDLSKLNLRCLRRCKTCW